MSITAAECSVTRRETLADAAEAFRRFIQILGVDTESEHLRATPERVARMYHDELLNPEPFVFTTFDALDQALVVVRDIDFWSICAHHFVPFHGTAHVGYIPRSRAAGLSKLARAVDHFARGPQQQEHMTAQIADFLCEQLDPLGVAVSLSAEHLCMAMRGVRKSGAATITTALRGAFMDDAAVRAEFLAAVRQ